MCSCINVLSAGTWKNPWASLCLFLLQVRRHFGHYDKLSWSHICEIMTMSCRKSTSGWNMKTLSSQNPDSWLPADETSGLWELINFHLSLLFRLHSDTALSLTLKSFLARHNLMYYVKQIYICLLLFSIHMVHKITILVLLTSYLNYYLKPLLRTKKTKYQLACSASEHQSYPGFWQ